MKRVISLIIIIFLFSSCDEDAKRMEEARQRKRTDSIAKVYHKGDFEQSVKMATSFVKTYPRSDVGWHLLSSSYLALEQDSMAEICARKALLINENNFVALTNIGILLDKKHKYEAAATYYEKALKINNKMPQTYSNYATNRLLAGDYERAVSLGETALKLSYNIGDMGILCVSYHETGQYQKRDSMYQKLKRLNYKNLSKVEDIIFDTTGK